MKQIKVITNIIAIACMCLNIQGQSYYNGFNQQQKSKEEIRLDSIINAKKERYKSKIIGLTIQLDSLENYLLHKDYLLNKSKTEYQKELLKEPGKKDVLLYSKYDSLYKVRETLKYLYEENLHKHPSVASVNKKNIEQLTNTMNSIKDSIRFSKKMPTKQVKNELYLLELKQKKLYNLMNEKIAENKELTNIYKDSLLLLFKKNHRVRELKRMYVAPLDLPKAIQNPLKNTLRITSDFGRRIHPTLKKKHFHYGIDLKSKNTSVYSVLPGRVTKVSYDKKLGIYVEVTHDKGLKTIYGHLSKFFVLEETIIDMNKPIGIIGETGRTTAPHLHFAVKYKNEFINPKNILQ